MDGRRFNENDLKKITASISVGIQAAVSAHMEESSKSKITSRLISTNVNHTELQPEGHMFTVTVQVEIHKQPTASG